MAFARVVIDECPGFGFTGGPEFSTTIKALQSGREKRNGDWAICRHRYSVPYSNITIEAFRSIKRVFYPMRGRLHTFLHRDWADYTAEDEPFGVGDGATTVFHLRKVSEADGLVYERLITKTDEDVQIFADGNPLEAVVDIDTGMVTFGDPPDAGVVLTWTGSFFVQVRFDTDYLPFSLDQLNAMNGTLDLIEVLEE